MGEIDELRRELERVRTRLDAVEREQRTKPRAYAAGSVIALSMLIDLLEEYGALPFEEMKIRLRKHLEKLPPEDVENDPEAALLAVLHDLRAATTDLRAHQVPRAPRALHRRRG